MSEGDCPICGFLGCSECEPEGDAPEFFRMVDELDEEGFEA